MSYEVLYKDDEVATIDLISNIDEVVTNAPQERDEDFSSFQL